MQLIATNRHDFLGYCVAYGLGLPCIEKCGSVFFACVLKRSSTLNIRHKLSRDGIKRRDVDQASKRTTKTRPPPRREVLVELAKNLRKPRLEKHFSSVSVRLSRGWETNCSRTRIESLMIENKKNWDYWKEKLWRQIKRKTIEFFNFLVYLRVKLVTKNEIWKELVRRWCPRGRASP